MLLPRQAIPLHIKHLDLAQDLEEELQDAELSLEFIMRWLLVLLVWSLTGSAVAAPKTKKKRTNTASHTEDLRMWDGSNADVSWVNDNPRPRAAPRTRSFRPWFSIAAGGGHRVLEQDTVMVQEDDQHEPLNEGRFDDLIENGNAYDLRVFLHPFSFISIGAVWHVEEAKLIVNNQAVSIAPQEFSGTVQVGPRLGIVRLYGFYSQIFASRSQASINAPTVVGDEQSMQTFKVDVKQSGGEAGVGTQLNWGNLGFFAEGVRSVNRSYELSLAQVDGSKTFQATARPSFKAWQFGLSLDF